MKAEEIIKQLQAVIPSVTDLFTDKFTVTSLTYSSGIVTAVTSTPHGLLTGNYTNIIEATNPISISSINRSGKVATVITDTAHDLTLSNNDIKRGGKSVTLTGSDQSEFNGTFELNAVRSRKKFEIKIADSGATSSTGSSLIQDGSSLPGYNGRRQITKIDASTFTYSVSQTLFSPAGGSPIAKTEARISGAVSFERADEAYTKMESNELWAFVSIGDVIASKNRYINSDLTDTAKKNTGWNQTVSQPFTVYVFMPSIGDRAGRISRDAMEDVSVALFKSLLGVKFNTGYFSKDQYVATFVNHGFNAYVNAYYVHEFNFELAADITFDDTVGYDNDVAFRDIDISIVSDIGTGIEAATASIDLDEEKA